MSKFLTNFFLSIYVNETELDEDKNLLKGRVLVAIVSERYKNILWVSSISLIGESKSYTIEEFINSFRNNDSS